jgi:transposase
MIRERHLNRLENWLSKAPSSGLPEFKHFVPGIKRDRAAVEAILGLPWSNEPVEGH